MSGSLSRSGEAPSSEKCAFCGAIVAHSLRTGRSSLENLTCEALTSRYRGSAAPLWLMQGPNRRLRDFVSQGVHFPLDCGDVWVLIGRFAGANKLLGGYFRRDLNRHLP